MAKKTGHNATCKIDGDNNGTYDTVAQVVSISGANGINPGEIDATTLDDPISPYMIPATVDEIPPVVLTLAYDPNATTHSTIRSLTAAHTSFAMQIVLNNYSPAKTWQCSAGYFSNFQQGEVTSRGLMTCTVTYRPQAVPTF